MLYALINIHHSDGTMAFQVNSNAIRCVKLVQLNDKELIIIFPLWWKPSVAGNSPAQRTNNAFIVSTPWRHHDKSSYLFHMALHEEWQQLSRKAGQPVALKTILTVTRLNQAGNSAQWTLWQCHLVFTVSKSVTNKDVWIRWNTDVPFNWSLKK